MELTLALSTNKGWNGLEEDSARNFEMPVLMSFWIYRFQWKVFERFFFLLYVPSIWVSWWQELTHLQCKVLAGEDINLYLSPSSNITYWNTEISIVEEKNFALWFSKNITLLWPYDVGDTFLSFPCRSFFHSQIKLLGSQGTLYFP